MDKKELLNQIKTAFPNYKNNLGLDVVVGMIENWQDEPITPEGLERLGFVCEGDSCLLQLHPTILFLKYNERDCEWMLGGLQSEKKENLFVFERVSTIQQLQFLISLIP